MQVGFMLVVIGFIGANIGVLSAMYFKDVLFLNMYVMGFAMQFGGLCFSFVDYVHTHVL
jgi:hypothetical protein